MASSIIETQSASRRRGLLATVSAAAMLLASPAAVARPLGGPAPSPSAAAVAAAQSAAQGAAQQAASSLKRATLAVQAMQAAQQAARNLALTAPSAVPNGLQAGGLVVMPGATSGVTDGGAGLWQGANLPTESKNAGRTQVTVKQNEQKAILTWKEFNVGRETDLYFDQRAGGADATNWIALNRVTNPGAAPSAILGSIKAEGQVYVINKNGIIFGGASQVDVGALVASSLSLSNKQFMAGINTLFSAGAGGSRDSFDIPQFGYLGQPEPQRSLLIDDSRQAPRTEIGAPPGDVRVEAGARIAMASGGKAMLFAPHVINAGLVSAPDGQVIMAAGEQVYLKSSLFSSELDPSKPIPLNVRGLDVAVSAAMPWLITQNQQGGDSQNFTIGVQTIVLPEMNARAASVGYQVVNNGIVQSERGNITMIGRNVVQHGALMASTALNNRDGSIRLQAWGQGIPCNDGCDGPFVHWSPGTLTLAPGSVTAVVPDLSDTSEIELSALLTRYRPGRVELRGELINIESQANVLVPAGTISVVASTNAGAPEEPGRAETVRDGSRIYIGEEAYLSVAGLQDVLVAMESNVIKAELRINELRDSPLYRDSWLRGQTVYVDRRNSGVFTDGPMAGVQWVRDKDGNIVPGAWVGTPLADVSAWIGVGKTTLAELSASTGISVPNPKNANEPFMLGGSIILKSSGSIITRSGSLLDVSGGSVRYADGWIKTTKLIGANGRIYDIAEATPDQAYMAFGGGFTRSHARWNVTETWTSPLGKTSGRYERGYTEGRNAGSIQFYAAEGVVLEGGYWGGVVVGERQAASGEYARAGSLAFGGNGDDDRTWLLDKLIVTSDPALLSKDFNATTPLGASWYIPPPPPTPALGQRTTYLDAGVLAASSLDNITLYVSGDFILERGTTLDLKPGSTFEVSANSTAAYTQNHRIDGTIRAPGGSVNMLQAESIRFGAGSAIDVGGQWINEVTNRVAALAPLVNGGSIVLATAQFEPGAVLDVSGGGWYKLRGGKLQARAGDAGKIEVSDADMVELAKADLRAYAAGSGGSLVLKTTDDVQIGGAAPAADTTVRLSETLFSERGFRSVNITAGSITVPAGVTVTQFRRSVDMADVARVGSGASIADIGPIVELPLWLRRELDPTALTLTSGNVTIGEGAKVITDVGGSITIGAPSSSSGAIDIAGRLEALAGKISLSAGRVTIASTGSLVANGVPAIRTGALGLREGVVLGGGSVALTAPAFSMLAGSLIDVSGASGEIDVMSGGLGRKSLVPLTIASSGGSISATALSATGSSLVEGTVRGQSGGAGARGGNLSLSSGGVGGPLIISDTAAVQPGLVFRPSVLQSAGFTDLTLTSSAHPIRLEGVDLALGSSISITGGLINGNGANSRLAAPYIFLDGGASSSPARAGTLTIAASLIDVGRSDIRGFAQTALEASDIRFLPSLSSHAARLDVDGTLKLRAAQVYPASQVSATIKASDRIIVEQNGTAAPALSVGGILTLEAPAIEQGGTLKAPFGQIVLKASSTLTLGAGSVTSVSGDGLLLPYGNLRNGEEWVLPPADGFGEPEKEREKAIPIASLPEKRITLEAPSVNLAAGSTVDIRGGGDLYAWEHVPGPGGSQDVLTRPGMFAIMPSLGPVTAIGERIWLDGGNRLAAGWYTVLPAQYALLPGAYAVQMVSGSQGASIRKSVGLAEGSAIMAGYRGNGLDGSHDQLPSSWRVMSGDVVRKYSEYNEAFANTFFASDAFKLTQYRLIGREIVTPRLPMDGGSVVFKATQQLVLNGQLRSQAAAGGRGGLVDIAAEKIAVVGAGQDAGDLRANGYLVLDATSLSNFGAGSLLLGGTRSGDTRGLRVDVSADDIIVRNNSSSALTGSEIILAASETIDIGAGSVIAASGNAPRGAGDLVIAPQVAERVVSGGGTPDPSDDVLAPSRDWGALIRLSSGDAVRVIRENVDLAAGGVVTIGAGATLEGGNALLVDATRNTYMQPGAQLSGATLSVASGRIGFGGGSGLVLDQAALAMLRNTQNLVLRSYTSIDFHNAVDLSGLRAVTFDAAVLAGYGTGSIDVVASRLVLENSTSTFSAPASAGHGHLNLVAEELAFGQGAKALRGFDALALTGTTRIVGEGEGSLDADRAAVTLSTPLLTGRGGAGQSLTTTGELTVAAHGTTAQARDVDSLGARWSLTGSSVIFGGRANAFGGAVELTATRGDVIVSDAAVIDVGGYGKQFFDVPEYANAGRIALTASGGSVRMAAGSVLDLAAQPGGGGAGSLAITSDGSQVVLDGTIRAQAAAGQRGGSFSLDIAALPSFSALSQRLNEAGFSKARSFRVRSGNVTLDGSTLAEEFSLSADQGIVTVAGSIDARSTYGGKIGIYGGQGLVMTGGAVLRAGATDTVDNLGSGRITLGISSGALVVQGGLIDVGGGEGGKVTLRAPVIEQSGADTVNVAFAGSIAGAREIVLEGFKRFDLADLADNPNFVGVKINNGQAELDLAATAAGKLNVLADYGAGTLVEFVRDFNISGAYGALSGLQNQPNFHARPGMELDYAGDIVLKSNWNLGAGIVDQNSAIAAGVMVALPALPGRAYVLAGKESQLLRDHTTMVYRTGGSILGEPGVLVLRAEGDLILNGSITDGFFQYADPLDPTYLAVKGTTSIDITALFNVGRRTPGSNLTAYAPGRGSLPNNYVGIGFVYGGNPNDEAQITETKTTPPQIAQVPYSAASNSPAANTGNSLAYSVMFPSVTKADGSTAAVSSWSQTLVAGAAPRGESADPARLAAGTAGKIVLNEQAAYDYIDSIATVVARGFVDTGTNIGLGRPTGTQNARDWIASLELSACPSGYPCARMSDNSGAAVMLGVPSDGAYAYLNDLWNQYAAAKGLISPTSSENSDWYYNESSISTAFGQQVRRSVVTKYSTFKDFYTTQIAPNIDLIASLYASAKSGATGGTVHPTTMVRTGTGDINMVARGDLQLKGGASIYSAGRRDLTVFNDFTTAPANATYGVDGGHVRIDVGGSIDVALPAVPSTVPPYTDWLKRQGQTDLSYVYQQQSSWWVDPTNFKHGVGALGGGNVDVSAGGDLVNLTVALPANGRVRGGRTAGEGKLLELRNGGAMTVEAGGAVKAGYYYIGRGAGTIEAGEFAIGHEVTVTEHGSPVTYPIAPVLSLGDATMEVRTAGDLLLQTVLDPLLVGRGADLPGAYMSGTTGRTALSLTSTGGDVRLLGQTAYLPGESTFGSGNTLMVFAGNLYPSKTAIAALHGSVINEGTVYTLPGTSPELRILAANDVLPGEIIMSRALPEMIPSPLEPIGGPVAISSFGNVLANTISPTAVGHELRLYRLGNPAQLPNANDDEASRIYALTGSIAASPRGQFETPPPSIVANEQTWIRAGKDIRNIYYDLRNIHSTDVSLVEAGNDIIGGMRARVFQPLGDQPRFGGRIDIQGPGALALTAGRDVYGGDLRLYSMGNRKYSDDNNRPIENTEILGLPKQGASITVMAGLQGKQPSYEAFLSTYLDPANVVAMPAHLTTMVNGQLLPLYLTDAFETRKSGSVKTVRNGLVSFMEEMTGEKLSPLDAWGRFQTLPQFTRERFLRQVYMQELREAGADQNSPGEGGLPRNGGYNRGYAAIEKLFPGKDWKGDVAIGNALFRTMAGGDIEVLTPGGGLQVAALGTDPDNGYGLVTLGHGSINIFARNNVVVNRSRILTFAGGDETIWSTLGDIDAGRGAKTTRLASMPEVQTDVDAMTKMLEKADISGSGIGTIVGFAGVEESDVNLIAPQGTVNAGDAGVRVSGNLNLAALYVLNANNFQVSGEVKGLSAKEVSVPAIKLEGGDLSQKAAIDAVKDVAQSRSSEQPSIIIVEVLGFGGGDGNPPADEKDNRGREGREQRTQNPGSAVQVVGAGELDQSAINQLTPEERKRLIQ